MQLLEEFLADHQDPGQGERVHSAHRPPDPPADLGVRLGAGCETSRLESFTTWRGRQSLAPKTLNHFYDAASAFLNWLHSSGRIPANPLGSVSKVDVRGKQQERRAFTDEEMGRLLAVSTSGGSCI